MPNSGEIRETHKRQKHKSHIKISHKPPASPPCTAEARAMPIPPHVGRGAQERKARAERARCVCWRVGALAWAGRTTIDDDSQTRRDHSVWACVRHGRCDTARRERSRAAQAGAGTGSAGARIRARRSVLAWAGRTTIDDDSQTRETPRSLNVDVRSPRTLQRGETRAITRGADGRGARRVQSHAPRAWRSTSRGPRTAGGWRLVAR